MTNRTPLLVERNPRIVPIVRGPRRLPLTGTQRIEAVLPARLMRSFCINLKSSPDANTDFLDRAARAFEIHCEDAWAGITDGERKKSADRLKAAVGIVLDPFEGQELPLPLYTVTLLIQDLLADGSWTYPDGGAFDVAWNSLAEVIWADKRNERSINSVEKFAARNAPLVRKRLAEAGYYLTPAPAIFARIGAE